MSALTNWIASGRSAPILYLPLNDPTQPGKNLGTGGDFALNGVVARSGRGPSQFNAPYSDFDGSADYLSRTTVPAGLIDGKQVTVAGSFTIDSFPNGASDTLFRIGASSAERFEIEVTVSGVLNVRARNSANALVFGVQTSAGAIGLGRNYTFQVSFDLSDINKRHLILNGSSIGTFYTYTNDTIELAPSSLPKYSIGCRLGSTPGTYTDGRLGNVFFDTRYIDLSQPANLAKFVTGTGIDAKPADLGANGEKPFGTPPLIYLPMYGNNAGKNYGTGGDFTVNSGPFTGARGPNEFWGNKAGFGSAADGSNTGNANGTGYLTKSTAITNVSASNKFSLVFWCNGLVNNGAVFSFNATGPGEDRFTVTRRTDSLGLRVTGKNSSGSVILDLYTTVQEYTTVGWRFLCVDLSDSSRRFYYRDNVNDTALITWNAYSNQSIAFNTAGVGIGCNYNPSGSPYDIYNGKLSEFYFTTDYIDFSQEANRLKFRDVFGNPVDLAPQIAAGTLPNPAIYMRFDPANFGKNSGTGGDFVVNGTITDGGQL